MKVSDYGFKEYVNLLDRNCTSLLPIKSIMIRIKFKLQDQTGLDFYKFQRVSVLHENK